MASTTLVAESSFWKRHAQLERSLFLNEQRYDLWSGIAIAIGISIFVALPLIYVPDVPTSGDFNAALQPFSLHLTPWIRWARLRESNSLITGSSTALPGPDEAIKSSNSTNCDC